MWLCIRLLHYFYRSETVILSSSGLSMSTSSITQGNLCYWFACDLSLPRVLLRLVQCDKGRLSEQKQSLCERIMAFSGDLVFCLHGTCPPALPLSPGLKAAQGQIDAGAMFLDVQSPELWLQRNLFSYKLSSLRHSVATTEGRLIRRPFTYPMTIFEFHYMFESRQSAENTW